MKYLWSVGSIVIGWIAWGLIARGLIARGAFVTFSQPTCTAVIILTAVSFAFGLVGLRGNTLSKILSVLGLVLAVPAFLVVIVNGAMPP